MNNKRRGYGKEYDLNGDILFEGEYINDIILFNKIIIYHSNKNSIIIREM